MCTVGIDYLFTYLTQHVRVRNAITVQQQFNKTALTYNNKIQVVLLLFAGGCPSPFRASNCVIRIRHDENNGFKNCVGGPVSSFVCLIYASACGCGRRVECGAESLVDCFLCVYIFILQIDSTILASVYTLNQPIGGALEKSSVSG